MKKFIGILLLFSYCIQPSSAQTPVPKDYEQTFAIVDQWLEAMKDFDRLPGMTVCVVKDQEILFSKGYGYADVDRKLPMDASAVFSICSISKLFTSVAIMQLAEQGKLHLDDSIAAVLPSYNLPQQFNGSGPVTIRSILTHSSGIPRDADYPYWSAPDFYFPTTKEVNEKMAGQKTVHPASRYFQYSNLGISLLGEIVAHISGMSYEAYVEKYILTPLRLTATHPFLEEKLWGNKMAIGYNGIHRDGHRDKMPFFQTKGIAPAAGFSSTAQDLAHFASWQFRLLKKDTTELLRSSSLREMQRVQFIDPDWTTSRGLGFSVRNLNGKSVVGHSGSCPGYLTSLSIYPDDTIAIVVMINAQAVSLGKYTDGIYNLLKKAKGPAAKPAITNLSDYTGIYDGYTWAGESIVVQWNGNLGILGVPSADPSSITMLQKVSGDVFNLLRRDGKPSGMQVVFGRDASGKVIRMIQGSSIQPKIK
jgi:CubicO group peptidase (beta-lactamase class C family)